MQNTVMKFHSFLYSIKNNLFRDVGKLVIFSVIASLLLFAPACDENNNTNVSGEPFHGVLLGSHNEDALVDIREGLDVGFFQGPLHNIILDGSKIDELSADEIQTIRDAFNQGFIILLYDMNEARITFFYRDILGHENLFEELEGQDVPKGDSFDVFTIENHDGLEWTSQSHSFVTDEFELAFLDPPDNLGIREFNDFTLHAFHMREWIEGLEERQQELIEDGLIEPAGLDELIRLVEAETRTSSQDGTLLDLATAWIQTSQIHIGFTGNSSSASIVLAANASEINIYQITNKAWLATNDTPTGINSFLLINQDMNLASSNGFLIDKSTQQGWYLSEFKNVNTLRIGSSDLDENAAVLIEESPATNQATTSTETTSVSESISGTVGADQDGANASVSGGVSWSTSNTFSKANVSINNLSLAETTLGNDASWQYLPRKASILNDSCDNSIHDLADLAHNTFTPTQAFVHQINGSSNADKTLNIRTKVTMTLTNTYIDDCNLFGCGCSAKQQTAVPVEGQTTFTQSVHIPAAP